MSLHQTLTKLPHATELPRHLTLDVVDALASGGRRVPVESFFCGLGGADVSQDTWSTMARITADAAARGEASRTWHLLHEGLELEKE